MVPMVRRVYPSGVCGEGNDGLDVCGAGDCRDIELVLSSDGEYGSVSLDHSMVIVPSVASMVMTYLQGMCLGLDPFG